MLTVFNLVPANQEKLLPEMWNLLSGSKHHSLLNGLSESDFNAKILEIRDAGGVVMVVHNMGAPEGTIVLQRKNDQEMTLIDFVMRDGYEPRAVDVLFTRAQRNAERKGHNRIFGSMEWFNSVSDKAISNKLIRPNA